MTTTHRDTLRACLHEAARHHRTARRLSEGGYEYEAGIRRAHEQMAREAARAAVKETHDAQ